MKKILCFVLMACTLAGCDEFSERRWYAEPCGNRTIEQEQAYQMDRMANAYIYSVGGGYHY